MDKCPDNFMREVNLFRNVIWDVDGTLFDTYPAIAKAFKAGLNDLGKDAPLIWIERLAKQSLGHCVSTLADQFQLSAPDIEQAFGEHYDSTMPEALPPFPGVIAICKYICSIGGKNLIVTHRGRAGTAELLTANDMALYFADCLARDDGYPKKPHPGAFDAIIKTHNLRREETMTVGDRDIDMLAGRAAGVCTCLFGSESDGVVADLVIASFAELFHHLAGIENVAHSI
ncbi:MAG: HAD-IA family hydrolase [Chloroflexi bacterium]|nr:HAD-IA family hydrolase [Chloroflexota bacterium]